MRITVSSFAAPLISGISLQNASDDVEKMILGNKCDLEKSRIISTERGELVSKVKIKYW